MTKELALVFGYGAYCVPENCVTRVQCTRGSQVHCMHVIVLVFFLFFLACNHLIYGVLLIVYKPTVLHRQ